MLRLQGLTLRFSCFITKATASIGRGEQKGSQCKAVWDWPAGCTADGKLGQDVLWDYRLLEQCACVVYLCATPCYLFSWQTEEIKRNITLVVASCDKQIVGILNLLKHLTQGTGVTFKIKFDRHSGRGGPWMKFDWQTEEGGPWQASRAPEKRKAYLCAGIDTHSETGSPPCME